MRSEMLTLRPTVLAAFGLLKRAIVRPPCAESRISRAVCNREFTIGAPGYPPTSFRLPAVVPKAIAAMTPAALKPGKNMITVTAHDSITGKSIDGRVMLGNDEAGFTNQPIAIEWKKGTKRPEIWLKPYLDRYSDVVIEPAEK